MQRSTTSEATFQLLPCRRRKSLKAATGSAVPLSGRTCRRAMPMRKIRVRATAARTETDRVLPVKERSTAGRWVK